MPAKQQLSLNIVDGCNSNNFTIIDTSSYIPNATISCPTIGITIPGQASPIYFSQDTICLAQNGCYPLITTPSNYEGVPKFTLTVDNIFLKVQAQGETLLPLADGLWTISYCIAPCDTLKVEYYYLRIVQALNKYSSLLCKLRLGNCLPSEDTLRMIDELHVIKMYLDAAKAKVEICHAPKEGQALYEYAVKLMNKWESACCSNC